MKIIHFPTSYAMEAAIDAALFAAMDAFEMHAKVLLTEEQGDKLMLVVQDAFSSFCVADNDGKELTPENRILSAMFGAGVQRETN